MIKILELFGGVKIKVYSDGRIETFDHTSFRKNGRKDNRKGRVLNPSVNKYGYHQIVLTENGTRKTYTVHRLVAEAFLENKDHKPTVNHIDGNKLNNDYRNLEWATHKEQKHHSIKTGLAKENVKALEKANKNRSKPVTFRGKYYKSINEAARENGVHGRVILKEGVMQHEQHY